MDPEKPGLLLTKIHLEEEEDWMIHFSDGQDTEATITTTVTLESEDINQVLAETTDNGVVEDKTLTNWRAK